MPCVPLSRECVTCGAAVEDFYPVDPKTGNPSRRAWCVPCYEDGFRRHRRDLHRPKPAPGSEAVA